MKQTLNEFQNSYDRVAADYAEQFKDELSKKAFDCRMLDRLVETVGARETICDLGCGAGHIARYLKTRGATACGIDLSAGMIEQARALNPDISFQRGNMLDLKDVADESFGGVAAFYSIIHVPREFVTRALREIKRVLRPKGTLLLTFHIGREIRHLDEWFGKKVSLDFYFFETDEMKQNLEAAGFEIEEAIEREPIPDVEVQTRRAYIFARKPRLQIFMKEESENTPHEWRRDEFTISTERERINFAFVHEFLSRSYWANNIPFEVVRRSIENSLCFGIYEAEKQVGFARVVTDRATFAYLCDVFVIEEYRGRGLSKWLMETTLAHPEAQNLRRWMLATRDAHGLYGQFGFTALDAPEIFMQRHAPDVYLSAETKE